MSDRAAKEIARLTTKRIELAEDARAALKEKICYLADILPDSPTVEITYFQPDKKKSGVLIIVRVLKQETTYYLWVEFESFLKSVYWKKRILWSDGYFACSIGDASSETIQKYIELQG